MLSIEFLNVDTESLSWLIKIIPLLIPLVVLQFGLMLYAVIDIMKKRTTKTLNVALWLVIACMVNMIGPVLYIIFGKADAPETDDDI